MALIGVARVGMTLVGITLVGMMIVTFEAAVGGCAVGFRLTTLGGSLTRSATTATTASATAPTTTSAFTVTCFLAGRDGAGTIAGGGLVSCQCRVYRPAIGLAVSTPIPVASVATTLITVA